MAGGGCPSAVSRSRGRYQDLRPCRVARTGRTLSLRPSVARKVLTVTLAAPPGAPGQQPSPGPGMTLRARPGDTLVIDGAGMPGVPRTGVIITVAGRDGAPPYLVRWTTGDYQSRISPGPGARIEPRAGQRVTQSSA